MTITKSPPSTCGANVGLCLPRSRVAIWTASRPSVTSVASITCHSRVTSAGFGLYVRTVVDLRSQEVDSSVLIDLGAGGPRGMACLYGVRESGDAQRPPRIPARSAPGQSERLYDRARHAVPGLEQTPRRISVAGKDCVQSRPAGDDIPASPASDAGIEEDNVTEQSLTVRDNRTGQEYDLAITDGTIRAADLKQVIASDGDGGLASYDPGFVNTASCRSSVTFIDGDKGILEYRGYPIEQLAEQSTYLEVAYLLVHGELPTQGQLDEWTHQITIHTFVHENVKEFMGGFRHDAHPMGMLLGSVGALSTFYPDANDIQDPENRYSHTIRLTAKMPTLAAFAFRHSMGQPYVYPDNDLAYSGNFLNMMYKMTELKYEPDPRLERALDILFILHADHEQNCSTSAVRSVGSS